MPNFVDITAGRQQAEVAFQEWLPDIPGFESQGFPVLFNAFPADNGLYKPKFGFQRDSVNTLIDLVAGVTVNAGQLVGVRNPATNGVFWYTAAVDQVADTMHFFEYTESTRTWGNVTPLVAPTHPFDGHAYFSTFGTRIYATAGNATAILAKDIGGGGNFASITDAHRFRDATVIRGFLMGISYQQGVAPSAQVPTGVAWSADQDPENWINVTTDPLGALAVLRGETQLEGGGRLQRIIPGVGGADATIFGQSKIWRVTFIGAPTVWDFQIVEEDEGTSIPTSVVSDGDRIVFYGRRGWMEFDGGSARPIGAGKVNYSFIRRDTNRDFSFDPGPLQGFNRGLRSAVLGQPYSDGVSAFLYRSDTDDTFVNLQTDGLADIETTDTPAQPIEATVSSDFPDTMLFYNKFSGRWGNAKLGLQAIGRGETNLNAPDTPAFQGLDTGLGMVTFNGAILPATFRSQESTGGANSMLTVRQVWPYINNNNCTIRLAYRNSLGEDQQLGAARTLESDASVPVNESGRFVAVQLEMPEGQEWLDGLIGCSVEFADQGIGSVVSSV